MSEMSTNVRYVTADRLVPGDRIFRSGEIVAIAQDVEFRSFSIYVSYGVDFDPECPFVPEWDVCSHVPPFELFAVEV